jgi:hypothetical protein
MAARRERVANALVEALEIIVVICEGPPQGPAGCAS